MRLFFAAALLFSAAPLVSAQATFGLKAGLNTASMGDFEEDSDFIDKTPRLGLAAGAWVRYGFGPSVSAQVEALYSQKGVRFRSVTSAEKRGDEDFGFDYDVDYLEVPVLVRFAPDVSPTLDVGIAAGPAVAFKVGETLSSVRGGESTEFGGEDVFQSTDVGIAAGVDIGSGPFGVDLRYTLGLWNISRAGDETKAQQGGLGADNLKNSAFTVAAVYRFGQ